MSAESRYREAFERLKSNAPIRVPVGTPVSQNNVALEAGVDTSALKLSRFPELIREIKAFIGAQEPVAMTSARQVRIAREKRNRTLEEQLASVRQQRDKLASALVDADAHILELRARIVDLERKGKDK